MYICICQAITEQKLQEIIKKGLREQDALTALGVGNSCGLCLIDAIEKISQTQTRNSID